MRIILLFCLSFCFFQQNYAQIDTLKFIEIPSVFPGGDEAFFAYLVAEMETQEVSLPKEYEEKRGLFGFTIDTMGFPVDLVLMDSIHPLVDDKMREIIENMPQWTPAQTNGRLVPMRWQVPYTYTLQNEKTPNRAYPYASVHKKGITLLMNTGPYLGMGDFGKYAKSMSWNVGWGLGYNHNNWTFGMQFDLFATSKVKSSFLFNSYQVQEGDRLLKLNLYVPVGYRFELSEKWTVEPYLCPVVNNFIIDLKGNPKQDEPIDASTYSGAVGIKFYRLVKRKFIYKPSVFYPFGNYRSAYLGVQLQYNPVFLRQPNTVQMDGGFLSLSVLYSGWEQSKLRKPKKT